MEGLLKTVTGRLPDLVREGVVLAGFPPERIKRKNGKIQLLGLWIGRFEGEWIRSDRPHLRHDCGFKFQFWHKDGTILLAWYPRFRAHLQTNMVCSESIGDEMTGCIILSSLDAGSVAASISLDLCMTQEWRCISKPRGVRFISFSMSVRFFSDSAQCHLRLEV